MIKESVAGHRGVKGVYVVAALNPLTQDGWYYNMMAYAINHAFDTGV